MASQIQCRCGFDLALLREKYQVRPEQGDVLHLTCPLCGTDLKVGLDRMGIIARNIPPGVSFDVRPYLRWKQATTIAAPHVARLGDFQIVFPINSVEVREPREVCYTRIPVFAGQGESSDCMPDLPVRQEYFDCVDSARFERMLKQGQRATISGGEYQVRLPLRGLEEGREETPVRIPLETIPGAAGAPGRAYRGVNLRVWPNIDSTGWSHYLVGMAAAGDGSDVLFPRDAPIEGTKEAPTPRPAFRLRVRTNEMKLWSKPFASVQRGGNSLVGSSVGRPTWVSFEVTEAGRHAVDAADASCGGLFSVATTAEAPAGHVDMGLDFGTSNTCVALKGELLTQDEHRDEPLLLPKVEKETDWNLYLVRGGDEARTHTGPDLWPTRDGFGRYGDLFASELLFARPKLVQMRDFDNINGWVFGIDYGISPANVTPAYNEADYVLSEFKWLELLQISAPSFAQKIDQLQSLYLTSVLANAYVRAASSYRIGFADVSVKWSYPMSFEDNDFQTLEKAAEIAQGALERLSGAHWTLTPGVNESVAAAASIEPPGNVRVYLDMGGGSTDIAVKFFTKKGWRDVYLTSVRYAGTSLLSAFEGEGRSTSCLKAEATSNLLRRRVRESTDIHKLMSDPELFNKQQDSVRKNRTIHFYGYLSEFVARLLVAGFLDQRFVEEEAAGPLRYPPNLEITLLFLGNGWYFNSFVAKDFRAALTSDITERFGLLYEEATGGDNQPAPTGDEETKYIKGVKAILDGQGGVSLNIETAELGRLPHGKAAVAFGLLSPNVRPERETRFRARSILGWNTRIDSTWEIPWHAMYERHSEEVPSPVPASSGGRKQGGMILGGPRQAPVEASRPDPTWYKKLDRPGLDWGNTAPKVPDRFESPFDLDQSLNSTRGALRRQCLNAKEQWFNKGPYEIMLEELFRKKLRSIGAR